MTPSPAPRLARSITSIQRHDAARDHRVRQTRRRPSIVPAVALPTSGTLTAKVNGVAADFGVTDFSLETDRDKLTGISAQPVTIRTDQAFSEFLID